MDTSNRIIVTIYVMLPISKQAAFTDIETTNIKQTIIDLAQRYRFAICCVDDGIKRSYYRFDGTPVFYDHTIKKWISRREYYELKNKQ